jgi:starch synthase (maltosyl-transferring)
MATQNPQPPRLVVERVSPQIDCGRYPIKRVVGDTVEVQADIYKDGHDLIEARVLYRRAGERRWREVAMRYDFNADRWSGRFQVDAIGRWQYAVEAWPDRFGTWQDHLKKRVDAGQDISVEILEGADLIEKSLERVQKPVKQELQDAVTRIQDSKLPITERTALALSPRIREQIYGPILNGDAARSLSLDIVVDRPRAMFASWYELFPRSQGTRPGEHGTFRDTQARLRDVAALGFDVVYLPPIHPIGRIHRKGRNNSRSCETGDVGSPWAIGAEEGGHTAVHPDLGTIEDFRSLVRTANDLGMEIALDIAFQCAPDHPWVKEHPEWFVIRADGSIRYAENPPKKYEDIYPLNFFCEDREGLWDACRDVLLFWVEQGVKTFRVDNPHTKAFAFWEWVIREVQKDHPDVVFFAEAFTRPKRMYGLAKAGFTMSYTYFTWKNAKAELTQYLEELTQGEVPEYFRPNFFANTPDILHAYLVHGGRTAFRVRLVLAGTLSPLYGIYSGYELCENTPVRPGSEEYLNSEKYEIRVRDWNAPGNIRGDVALINRIRRENPALQQLCNLEFIPSENENIIAYRKYAPGNQLIVVVNLDPHRLHHTFVHVPVAALGLSEHQTYVLEDLMDGARYTWRGSRNYIQLAPAERVAHVFRVVT